MVASLCICCARCVWSTMARPWLVNQVDVVGNAAERKKAEGQATGLPAGRLGGRAAGRAAGRYRSLRSAALRHY